MTRKVPEWIGKTDDSPIPDRVKIRVFEKYHGKCYLSGIRLLPGMWDLDHITALANGGEHRESNLAPIWKERHKKKTKEDQAIKSKTYRKKKANLGIRKKSRFPGSKDSPWKQKIGGKWVRR